MSNIELKSKCGCEAQAVVGDRWLDSVYNVPFDEFYTLHLTVPPANIYETNDDYEIFIAACGVRRKDFEVEVTEDVLIVRCNKKRKLNKSREGLKRQEYDYTNWERSFAIPDRLQMKKAAVTYSNGELRITIGKQA
jgi:HSP20 family protein